MARKGIGMRKKRSTLFKLVMSVLTVFALCFVWVAGDVIGALTIKDAVRRPSIALDTAGIDRLLWVYSNEGESNPDIPYTSDTLTATGALSEIEDTLTYIAARYDCSDFRAARLVKLILIAGDKLEALSPDITNAIKTGLTNFKFWITSEGDDSMCYHSENHEALFCAVEYLSGTLYPDAVFSIDGKTGAEHVSIARERFLTWLQLKYEYGFSEYYSANYYPVDIEALSLMLQYCDHTDASLYIGTAMITDLIFYDIATQMYDYTFVSPTGRAYDRNNSNGNNEEINDIINLVWGVGELDGYGIGGRYTIVEDMLNAADPLSGEPYYEVPAAIIAVGNEQNKTIKSSSGLDVSELQTEDLLGLTDRQIMFVLGMGAKTNPETVDTLLDIMNEYDLWSNNFLSAFKYLNISLIRALGLESELMEALSLITDGSAIERGNIYAYVTEYYKLATNCGYSGTYGDQQNFLIATLPGGVTVYTTHPATDNAVGTTPGYWAGSGMAPDAAQDQNISIALYNIPEGKIMLADDDTPQYTHAYFPEEFFDEVIIDGNYAFGRIGDSYIALIGGNVFVYADYNAEQAASLNISFTDTSNCFDLIQQGGGNVMWIYEMGCIADDGDFASFMARIKSNEICWNSETGAVSYTSGGRTLNKTFGGDFTIDGTVISTDYKRFDSVYSVAEREADTFTVTCGDYSLYLDFYNRVRTTGIT